MRRALKAPLALVFAALLVSASVGLAVESGMVDREDVSPVGESQALACGGLCLVGAAAAAGIAVGAVGASAYLSDSDVNKTELSEADTQERKTRIYDSATTQRQNNAIYTDSVSNYAQDMKAPATMVAKNEYIRQLENGSSESTARSEAKQAASNYFAQRQVQLRNQWEVSAERYVSLNEMVQNDSNIASDYLYVRYRVPDNANSPFETTISGTSQSEVTLLNGTSISVTTIEASSGSMEAKPTVIHWNSGSNDDYEDETLLVRPPNSNYQTSEMIAMHEYPSIWSNIETVNSDVQTRIDNFVNSTYDSYQQGEINSSDLVDPYLGAREYSPESNYGSFTLRTLSSIGLNPPENLSNAGTMTIKDRETGSKVEGVLMSDGLPQSGEIEIGTVYDAQNLTGPQYVVDSETGTTHDLTGEFVVDNATTADGEPLNESSIGYQQIDYQTTDMAEFKALTEQLRNTTVAIESRQQRLRDGGGGGLFAGIGGSFGFGLTDSQAGAAVAFIVIFLLMAMAAVVKS